MRSVKMERDDGEEFFGQDAPLDRVRIVSFHGEKLSARQIVDLFAKLPSEVTEFSFDHGESSERWCVAVMGALARFKIKVLRFNSRNLTQAAIDAIAANLPPVEYLRIDNIIPDCRSICKASLNVLNLELAGHAVADISPIIELVATSKVLKRVSFFENFVSDERVALLASAAEKSTSIEEIIFRGIAVPIDLRRTLSIKQFGAFTTFRAEIKRAEVWRRLLMVDEDLARFAMEFLSQQ